MLKMNILNEQYISYYNTILYINISNIYINKCIYIYTKNVHTYLFQ